MRSHNFFYRIRPWTEKRGLTCTHKKTILRIPPLKMLLLAWDESTVAEINSDAAFSEVGQTIRRRGPNHPGVEVIAGYSIHAAVSSKAVSLLQHCLGSSSPSFCHMPSTLPQTVSTCTPDLMGSCSTWHVCVPKQR